MSRRLEGLLALLADGALHSGADLAASLGVSRAAVWTLAGQLRSLRGQGESLPRREFPLPRFLVVALLAGLLGRLGALVLLRCLGEIGGAWLGPLFMRMLDVPEQDVRAKAARGLGRIRWKRRPGWKSALLTATGS